MPTESIEMDVRPGGAFRLTMVAANGKEFPADMVYHDIIEPERIVYGWEAQRGLGAGVVTVTFADLGGRTELTSHFAGYATDEIAAGAQRGTNQQLDKLEQYLTDHKGES